MCGITGFYSLNEINTDDNIKTISLMTDSISHRGPDTKGFFSDYKNNLYFGHTRLSILDLSSAGNQPLTSSSGNFTIVYNGEIYNHLSIRKEINNLRNINWRGNSDTETLIESIDTFGIELTVNKCIGMFSFAIWDKINKRLCLVRDRVGEKPLYYSIFNNTLIFGSEIKSIKAHHDFKNIHNDKALSIYFKLGYIPAPLTAWKNVKKLRPGCLIYFSENEFDLSNKNIPYWKITDFKTNEYKNYSSSDYLKKMDELINISVKSQMLSDVPIGAFLSGGVDSSTIVSFMQKNSKKPVNTFTIGFENQNYNEAKHAKLISKHLGTNHTDLYIDDKDALNVIPELPDMFDEPFGDTSAIPTYLVSKLASESVKVTLSGDGGDELFGGYKRYYNSKFNNLAYISNVFNKLGLNSILRSFSYKHGRNNGSYSDIKFAFDLIRSENFNSFYFKSISHWKDLPILNSDYNPSSFDFHLNSFYSNDNLQKRTGFDFHSYLPDDILTKLDRTAMAVSLESRVPFLDHRLIEFAWNIPTNLKYKNNTPKWLLREILYNYVPKKMIDRPKMGFGVPINSWLKGPLKIWAECLIYDDALRLNNFLDIKKIRLYWKMFLKGDNRLQHPLWLVLIYISWFKKN